MALVALVLVVVLALGFLGATLSSRARLEKKSIASFHERMGHLSGVVQHEGHLEDSDGELHNDQPHSLFNEAPVHVRVVGKSSAQPEASGIRSGHTARTRKPSSPSRGSASAPKGNPAGMANSSTYGQANAAKDHVRSEPDHEENLVETTSSSTLPNRPSRPAVPRRRSSRVSNAKRGAQFKRKTEVLHFDDSVTKPFAKESDSDLSGYERKVNTKVLAAASVAALIGLGTIVFSLSSSHGGTSVAPKNSGQQKVQQPAQSFPNRSTKTNELPVPANTPLTPSSADLSGAVYFINSPSITLVINASAASWVEESTAPGSTILWEGIIPAGGSKTLTLSSSMWIRTGNVDVLKMTANGQPVTFNAAPGVYNFTFRQGVKA